MSKYDALGDFLRKQPHQEVSMTFGEVERVTGVKLPPKAQHHRAWWSNNPSNNVMTKVWLDAGFRTERVDVAGRKLVFKRITKSSRGGMVDTHRGIHGSANPAGKKVSRHPLIGSMKGTFTIEAGYDLTKPMYSQEEWAEIEKETEKDWDQIEQGFPDKR